MPEQPATGELLRAARLGDKHALNELFTLAYDELRRIAHGMRRGGNDTLTTTALVHETYLKLLPSGIAANDRAHFRLLVGRAMRQVLVDAARRRMAEKRGGAAFCVSLDAEIEAAPLAPQQLLELNSALDELRRVDPRRASVVECRFFAGLDVEETAAVLNVSGATVKRDWRVARAWLAQAVE